MKKIIIGATALLLGGLVFFVACRKPKAAAFREVQPTVGPLTVEFRETGAVSPRNRLEIKPQVAGRIEDVLVVEGQHVKKGQVIAWMSSTDRAALLDAALSKGPEEVKKWEDIYKPTPIIAPLDGFIIARNKEPGQTVSQNDALLVMADNLIIEATIDETDLRYISLGQKVDFFLDAYPDRTFTGTVEHIAYESQVINNVTVYEVKIRPLSVPGDFRAGMTATIQVKAVPKASALLLPYDVIQDKGGRKMVLVKTGTGKPEPRVIETGVNNGTFVEITSGLEENETVLVAAGGSRDRKRSGNGPRMMGLPGMGGGRH